MLFALWSVFTKRCRCFLTEKTLTVENANVLRVLTTNKQYEYDAAMPLDGILELEFGFRDSLPVAAAMLATNLARAFNVSTSTAMHVGTATGRGSFELSKHFEKVCRDEVC